MKFLFAVSFLAFSVSYSVTETEIGTCPTSVQPFTDLAVAPVSAKTLKKKRKLHYVHFSILEDGTRIVVWLSFGKPKTFVLWRSTRIMVENRYFFSILSFLFGFFLQVMVLFRCITLPKIKLDTLLTFMVAPSLGTLGHYPSASLGVSSPFNTKKFTKKFILSFFTDQAGESNYIVLDTDYESYSAVYSCSEEGQYRVSLERLFIAQILILCVRTMHVLALNYSIITM